MQALTHGDLILDFPAFVGPVDQIEIWGAEGMNPEATRLCEMIVDHPDPQGFDSLVLLWPGGLGEHHCYVEAEKSAYDSRAVVPSRGFGGRGGFARSSVR